MPNKQVIIDCIAPSVKSQLKAPLTAVMCEPDALSVTSLGDNQYKAEGIVNSQNSYGAMIATDFSATVRENSDGTCSVISCTVGAKAAAQQAKQGAANYGIAIIWTLLGTAFFYFIYKAFLGF